MKQLDNYRIEILREKSKHSTLAIDSVLAKLQKCNSMAMGPLVRLWVDLEKARQSETESVSVSVSDSIYLTGQALLLMGQTNSTISYHHRHRALFSL